jgi:hypothetical protein
VLTIALWIALHVGRAVFWCLSMLLFTLKVIFEVAGVLVLALASAMWLNEAESMTLVLTACIVVIITGLALCFVIAENIQSHNEERVF